MVMTFKVETLLGLVRRAAQTLYCSFERIFEAIGTPEETNVVKNAYKNMEPLNLSRGLLEALSPSISSLLSVLPVEGVVWSDWGSERRLLSALRSSGYATPFNGIPEYRRRAYQENTLPMLLIG